MVPFVFETLNHKRSLTPDVVVGHCRSKSGSVGNNSTERCGSKRHEGGRILNFINEILNTLVDNNDG